MIDEHREFLDLVDSEVEARCDDDPAFKYIWQRVRDAAVQGFDAQEHSDARETPRWLIP